MAARPSPRYSARSVLRPRAARPSRIAGGAALVGTLVIGTGFAAHADPVYPSSREVQQAKQAAAESGQAITTLDAQYAAAAADVAALQERAARLGEAANGAKWELQQATQAAAEARRKAEAAERDASGARSSLREYASTMYQQSGSLGTLGPLLDAGGPQELIDRASTLELVSARQNDQLASALVVSGTAESLRAAADQAEAAREVASRKAANADRIARDELALAGAQVSRLGATRDSLASRLAGLRDTSSALERRRLDGIAADAADDAAASGPAAGGPTSASPPVEPTRPTSSSTTPVANTTTRPTSSTTTRPASTTTTTPPSTTPTTTQPTSTTTTPSSTTTTTEEPPPPPPPPPPSGGAGAAIAYAEAQLGKPYEWGADGPDSFDCSGLVMAAWAQAGVYLSHYTGAQYAETSRVPIDALQPGDLVFFGSSGESSTHVGLYVGGGQMIEAPYTGANVRYSSIYRSDLVPSGGRPG